MRGGGRLVPRATAKCTAEVLLGPLDQRASLPDSTAAPACRNLQRLFAAAAARSALRFDPVTAEALFLGGAGHPVFDREADRAVGGVAQSRDHAAARFDGGTARQAHD